MTLKNGFGKCSLFVLSANGWKDQNMDSSFSRQRKPSYGDGIVRLANRVAVWRRSEVSVDFQKVLGREVFSPVRSRNQPKATRLCIRSINQSISVRLLFLFCARVFISRSYKNRSNVNLRPGLWRNSIKRPLTGTPNGRFMEVQRQGER